MLNGMEKDLDRAPFRSAYKMFQKINERKESAVMEDSTLKDEQKTRQERREGYEEMGIPQQLRKKTQE